MSSVSTPLPIRTVDSSNRGQSASAQPTVSKLNCTVSLPLEVFPAYLEYPSLHEAAIGPAGWKRMLWVEVEIQSVGSFDQAAA